MTTSDASSSSGHRESSSNPFRLVRTFVGGASSSLGSGAPVVLARSSPQRKPRSSRYAAGLYGSFTRRYFAAPTMRDDASSRDTGSGDNAPLVTEPLAVAGASAIAPETTSA